MKNHLDRAYALILELKKEGRTELANNIKEALAAGATGLEMCAEIRFLLMKEPLAGLSIDTTKQLNEFIRYIDTLLN